MSPSRKNDLPRARGLERATIVLSRSKNAASISDHSFVCVWRAPQLPGGGHGALSFVEPLHVALVSRDASVRAQMAAAFDAAPASWKVTIHDEPVPADAVVYGPDVGAASGIPFDS